MATCPHDPHGVVFYGALNLNYEGKIVGSIDIWICKKCRDLSFEEKRFVDIKPTTELGFRGPGDGARWGVLVCYNKSGMNWVVMPVRPRLNLEHKCIVPSSPSVMLDLDWKVLQAGSEVRHKVILVDQHINKAVEITTA